MKRRISDMLDELPVEAMEMEDASHLSARRIKELTMKKIPTKKPKHRLFTKALPAAAIILALALSAAAVELGAGDWFRDIFRGKGNGEKLDDQVAYVDEIGKTYQESMTDQGTTVTPLAAYGDENICYLRLKITGPEGTVLPDDIRYAFYGNWDQGPAMLENPELYEGLWVLPDEDPTDNEKEFLIKVMAMPDAAQKLNDGTPVPYHIYGIYEMLSSPEGETEFKQLMPGAFTLDLSLCNQVERRNVDVKGVSYYREEIGTQYNLDDTVEEVPFNYTVTFSTMEITPLSISWVCDYDMSDPTWKVAAEVAVVMKDGTEAPIDWGRGTGFSEEHNFAASRQNGFFSAPIALEDVDYILIGGEHKVQLPAA